MSELKLAGNYISVTGLFGAFQGYGHLQIVYDDGTSMQEIEVQAPSSGLLGSWTYPDVRDHATNTPHYGEAGKYAVTTLDLGGRSADSVWNLLMQVRDEFSAKGTDISYDFYKNSNSYASTLLDIIGINVNDVISGAHPSEVSSFPGLGVNVLQIPGDAFGLNLTGTADGDFIRTGLGNDTLSGADGNDTLIGGGGTNTIDGGNGFDIARYEGLRGLYSIDFDNQKVTGPGGSVDNLSNIEVASFNDGIVALQTMSFEGVRGLLGAASLDAVAEAILQSEFGTAVSNVSYNGAGDAAFMVSQFNIGSAINLEGGFFLSSGGYIGTSNTSSSFSTTKGTPGDAQLDAVAQAAFPGAGATQDASTVQFDLNVDDPDVTGISFKLVFGSDEYPEYSNSSYVDVAAVFVNGVNQALFDNNAATPLSIIDANLANNNFIDNTGGNYPVEWDGFSQVLSIRAPLNQGTNTIKVGIADTGDSIYDSGLYVTDLKLIGGAAVGSGVLVVLPGGTGNDSLAATTTKEEIDLGGGADTVSGSVDQLQGDVIDGFGDDDMLNVDGAVFDTQDITVTLGSAILDIDTDQNGTPDLTVTMVGEYQGAEFSAAPNGSGGTQVTVDLALPPGLVAGGEDDDIMVGTEADELMAGGAGSDNMSLGAGNDSGWGQSGNDTIQGEDGDDRLFGNPGNDLLIGGDGADSLKGHLNDDTLQGDGGDDVLFGGGDNDSLTGGDGDDAVNGNSGNDILIGGDGNDTLRGQGGADQLGGGLGDDNLLGMQGADTLDGGDGNDVLIGGRADDVLIGGVGVDTFAFATGQGSDTIADFEDGIDHISLVGVTGFDALTITETPDGTMITFEDTPTTAILLAGVVGVGLTADDFYFS